MMPDPATTTTGILVASLIGSVHCAGMCGGFVCFYTGSSPAASGPALRGHALYHAGRLISYVALGAAAGALGRGVTQLGALAGIGQAAALAAGTLMVAWALGTLLAQRGVAVSGVRVPEVWQRMLGRVLQSVRDQPLGVRALLTGLFTTLLPCGWLYVFVATAGGTGSVRSGMLTMAVFWLGTVPALTAVGLGAQTLLTPFRRRLPAISALVVLALGLLTMAGRLAAMMGRHTHG